MINGNNVFIQLGEGDSATIIAGTKVNEIQTDSETIEISGPNSSEWREHIAGRKEWHFTTGYLVPAVDDVKDLLKTGMKVTILVAGRENGNIKKLLQGQAFIKQCKQSFTRGKLSQGSWNFLGTGPLIEYTYVESISLSPSSISLMEGEQQTLTPTVLPANACDKRVQWSSSDTSVATVDQDGKVTAVGSGSCTITCAAKDGSGVSATCACAPILVQEMSLTRSSVTVPVNDVIQKEDVVSAIVSPEDATNKHVTWSSNSENLIVTQTGDDYTIQAIEAGTYILTATAQDGSGVSASCYIFAENM